MGLFDRFKKRVEETEKSEGITADENSQEAIEALEQRKNFQQKMPEHQSLEQIDEVSVSDKWEEYDSEILDPFTAPISSKDRKLKDRLKTKAKKVKTLLF